MVDVESAVWTEKYRPDTLDEVIGNEQVVNRMKEWVEDDSVPNLLLSGPQGTGKTSAAVAFARDKYGDDWRNHFKQLNASDDRGINVIRNEVKSFAQLSTVSDYEFKVIFLDEADALTRDAQPALRRVMEDYADRTRFFLSCNYPNKIIDPIQSRCVPLRMTPLGNEQVYDLLEQIADEEDISYKKDQLEKITDGVEGDVRHAIYVLQAVTMEGEISEEMVDTISMSLNRGEVQDIVMKVLQGDMEEAMEEMDNLLASGADPADLCSEFSWAIKTSDLPDDSKVKMIDKVAECEWRCINGSKPQLQFNALLSNLRVAQHLSLEPYRRENEE